VKFRFLKLVGGVMEIVYVEQVQEVEKLNPKPSVMALGYFDGVHIGHQKVISKTIELAKQKALDAAVMTFYPHPSIVLRKDAQTTNYITPLHQKIKEIEKLGIDVLYIVNFNMELASLIPQEYVDRFLIGLNVKHVVAGFDFTFGQKGKGNMETMPFHSRGIFEQTVIDKVENTGLKISSTLIRELLHSGEVHVIPAYLGRYFEIEGKVVDGEKRGRTIGFPTANIAYDESYMVPPTGVYVVRMKVGSNWYNGVANIGYKPTFLEERPTKPTIEVHLINFNGSIYGETVNVEWHARLREEKKFQSVQELIEQILKDKKKAERYFQVK
jgi:riboflavin kinase / FMN adenylyltransferase